MLGWDLCGFHKKAGGTHYVEHVFLHLMRYAGHVVHSSASGVQNIDELFFMLGWDHYGFHKKHVEKPYTKLVFSHPVVSVGYVVHSGAYEA
jgi:hypothetical protein